MRAVLGSDFQSSGIRRMCRAAGVCLAATGLLLLWGCSRSAPAGHLSVLADLLQAAESTDDTQANTALLLLTHVALGDQENARLTADFRKARDPIRRLLLAHLIDVRFQSSELRSEFVRLYPIGREQRAVWKLASHYVATPSPLQDHLASIARTDAGALDKLISGLPFADGSDADAIMEDVQSIYHHEPGRVREALRKAGIAPAQIGLPAN